MTVTDDTPIEDLKLSIRAYNGCFNADALTVGAIKKYSYNEWLRVPNFGRTSLAELVDNIGYWRGKIRLPAPQQNRIRRRETISDSGGVQPDPATTEPI